MTQIAGTSAEDESPAPAHWAWVERCVWTERMLNALETGVKGGKWHNLIDKVFARRNLDRAFEKVAANGGAPGMDHVTIARYRQEEAHNQHCLQTALQDGSYQPQPILRVFIDKPGSQEKRPLGIPCVRDRVVQTALKHVMEPIFEREFHPHSYGFRPERSCRDALRQVMALMKDGYVHVVDADIKGYFDTIPWEKLIDKVNVRISDGRVLGLVRSFLEQNIMEGTTAHTPDEGTPQGGVISPLLANIYLNDFDWHMERHGIRIVRYADDFILLSRTAEEADRALQLTREWMQHHELTLHPAKTRLVDMSVPGEYINFLGYCLQCRVNRKGKKRILKKVGDKALKSLRARLKEHTGRRSGCKLEKVFHKINPILRGWYGYFKHAVSNQLEAIDKFIRRRLRRMLRKRIKRRLGTGRAITDHQRWPNAFFHNAGLFSLKEAWSSEIQPLRG